MQSIDARNPGVRESIVIRLKRKLDTYVKDINAVPIDIRKTFWQESNKTKFNFKRLFKLFFIFYCEQSDVANIFIKL